jgi:hypothetical protein
MSEAEEEGIPAAVERRVQRALLLSVAVGLTAAAGEIFFAFRFSIFTQPPQYEAVAVLAGLVLLFGVTGLVAWVMRPPPDALSERVVLRRIDRTHKVLSRTFLFFPLIVGLAGFNSSSAVFRGLNFGWRPLDVVGGLVGLLPSAVYLLLLTGWASPKYDRIVYDEELFRSFRMRGYVIGFWSLIACLPLVLTLGLLQPSWAVAALPLLIAAGVCVPAVTIALLNRRAERDG